MKMTKVQKEKVERDDVIVVVAVSRESSIVPGDNRPILEALRRIASSKEDCLRYAGTLSIVITGYEDDPRELPQIAEVRAWFRKLDCSWPYWGWFLNKYDDSLPLIASILCVDDDAESEVCDGKVGYAVDQIRFDAVKERMLEAIDDLVVEHNIPNDVFAKVGNEFLSKFHEHRIVF